MKIVLKFLIPLLAIITMKGFGLIVLVEVKDNSDIKSIVEGNTAFAFDLYAKLKKKKGNLFLSPYSISTSLAMTYAGARGQTQKEMAEVLHFNIEQNRLHQAFAELDFQLNAYRKKGHIQLSIANALWCQRSYQFLNEFLDLTRKYYSAGLHEVDFAKDTETARKTINTWVEKQTQEKIKELIKQNILTPLTTLVLSNAIHFHSNWAGQFDKAQTRPITFFITPKKTVTVPMMFQTSKFKWRVFNTFKAIVLPYAGNDLSMILFIPKEIDGLSGLENSLTTENVSRWIIQLDNSRTSQALIALPKFRVKSEFQIEEQLANLGMPSAFKNADFSGITGHKELFINAVIHTAFVDVNEEGTEAAAATAVVMERSKKAVLRADHPFFFMIRDNHSGSILFLGRVVNPKE